MLGFLDAGVSVAYHLVTTLATAFAPVAGPLAAAAAIVAFTIAVRLLLLPLSYYALRGQAAQARLQPQIAELRRRYASQPDRLQRELAAFYQREGGGLLLGCLPLLIQLPFFSVVYRLFLSHSIGGQPNRLLTHHLLGAPLGSSWLAAGPLGAHGLVFIGLFALLAMGGWLSARLASQATAAAQSTALVQQSKAPDSSAATQARAMSALTRIIPFTTVIIAMFVPLAAGLYLLTTTWWTLAERVVLRRRVELALARKASRADAVTT
ncbi:MAG TPA: membrane protein insertase YidC [Streptosporangiaceae bacterium]|jgi:YidC/Oxa1 family membrane protein insertase|nr:membrane protein insertase YidC [Streptosporangiaceae bacterium]